VFNVKDPKKPQPMGFIPTGWYPTSVRFNDEQKRIYVCNGKGLSSRANPQGPASLPARRAAAALSVHRPVDAAARSAASTCQRRK